MDVKDPGHLYQLLCLDGNEPELLRFVKREGPSYPGNVGSYPGANLQSVLRACIDRANYLQGQHWCVENMLLIAALRLAIWLLEFRAARRHGRWYPHGLRFASEAKMCGMCGHTECLHFDNR